MIMLVSFFVLCPKKENQGQFALKIFTISFITIFGGNYFLINKANDNFPEIEIGEANF